MNTELQDAIKALHAELRVSANGYGAVTVDERSLRTVLDALSSPPADDVREALAKRIADEVEYRVRTAVTLAMNGHEYEQHVTQGRESVAAILAEVRPYGTVTDAEVRCSPQQIIDEHMRKVAHRVMDVFENADEDDLAYEVLKRLSSPPADDVREGADASLTRLREVWTALGCANNPNDFHTSVQQNMWAQALDMIRKATARTSRVYRENQQLEEALRRPRGTVTDTEKDAAHAEFCGCALREKCDFWHASGLAIEAARKARSNV